MQGTSALAYQRLDPEKPFYYNMTWGSVSPLNKQVNLTSCKYLQGTSALSYDGQSVNKDCKIGPWESFLLKYEMGLRLSIKYKTDCKCVQRTNALTYQRLDPEKLFYYNMTWGSDSPLNKQVYLTNCKYLQVTNALAYLSTYMEQAL